MGRHPQEPGGEKYARDKSFRTVVADGSADRSRVFVAVLRAGQRLARGRNRDGSAGPARAGGQTEADGNSHGPSAHNGQFFPGELRVSKSRSRGVRAFGASAGLCAGRQEVHVGSEPGAEARLQPASGTDDPACGSCRRRPGAADRRCVLGRGHRADPHAGAASERPASARPGPACSKRPRRFRSPNREGQPALLAAAAEFRSQCGRRAP